MIPEYNEDKEIGFEEALRTLINRYCQEYESNTPDFILSRYMKECLDAFNKAIKYREVWYGIKLSPGSISYLSTNNDDDHDEQEGGGSNCV